jgi:hypothetical protein
MDKLPNFLIVGVPKAGTTSLYYWLKQHPEVFMSPIKEPHFFSQIGNEDHITKWEDYIKLFIGANDYKAVGEASTSYFHFYKKSIPLIKQYLGDIKILVILRNPIERAWSHYLFYRKIGFEENTNLNFIFSESYKIKNPKNSWGIKNPYLFHSFYYEPLKEFLKNFSEVKVLLYDDLKNHPLKLIREVYKFLEVNEQFIPNMEIRNVSGIPRNKFIAKFLSLKFSQKIIPLIPYRIKAPFRKWLLKRETIPEEVKSALKNIFEEDVYKTSELIGKDLSHWLEI